MDNEFAVWSFIASIGAVLMGLFWFCYWLGERHGRAQANAQLLDACKRTIARSKGIEANFMALLVDAVKNAEGR